MKIAINPYRINTATGLVTSNMGSRLGRKAKRLSNASRHVSTAVPDVGEEKPQSPDDKCLMEAIGLAQHGDAGAFEFIYRLHSRRVYGLCLRMVKDSAEAEDLTQEAFLQVFRKIHTFRGESAFSSWLHRLTVNIVLMRLRRKKPAPVPLEQVFVGSDDDDRFCNEAGGLDLHLMGIFDRVNLRRAVNQLPQGYKAAFILHDVKGYHHKEIARLFGCSVGTCKSQLHRARKAIREFLQGLQYHGERPAANS